MKVYVIKFDWSTSDSSDVELQVFGTYEKAYAEFNRLIENEKNPEISWVGDCAFNKNGKLNKGYELDYLYRRDDKDETEVYWLIENKNDWYQHSYISLEIHEVK